MGSALMDPVQIAVFVVSFVDSEKDGSDLEGVIINSISKDYGSTVTACFTYVRR